MRERTIYTKDLTVSFEKSDIRITPFLYFIEDIITNFTILPFVKDILVIFVMKSFIKDFIVIFMIISFIEDIRRNLQKYFLLLMEDSQQLILLRMRT